MSILLLVSDNDELIEVLQPLCDECDASSLIVRDTKTAQVICGWNQDISGVFFDCDIDARKPSPFLMELLESRKEISVLMTATRFPFSVLRQLIRDYSVFFLPKPIDHESLLESLRMLIIRQTVIKELKSLGRFDLGIDSLPS